MPDAQLDEPLFQPNRAQRRQLADRPCCKCDDLLTDDVLGVRTDDSVLWLHGACVRSLLENAETVEGEEQ